MYRTHVFTMRRLTLATAALVSLAACSGEQSTTAGDAGAASPASSAAPAPTPTGNVITVEMITDDSGNYFKPNEITAKPGDVLKFVLVAGVHNVHFLPDSNPGAEHLPAATAFAQLPQQALEVPVTMAAGKSYYFQCDPHAALGMKGHVTVQ